MSTTFWRFLKYARPYWLLISGAIVTGILKFTMALMLPATLGYVVDHIFLADLAADVKIAKLKWILGLLTLVFVGRAFMTYLRAYLAQVAGNRTIFDIRRDLFRHLQRLSLAYHNHRRTGETTARLITDLNEARGIVQNGVISVSMDLIFLMGVVLYLFIWDWRLATASLFTLPFYGVVFRAVKPRLRLVAASVQEEMEEMSGEVTEKLAGLPVVMSFVREKTEEIKFFRRHRRYYTKLMKRVKLRMTLTSVAEFLSAFGPVIVIFYGGYRIITDPLRGVADPLTIGQLIMFNGFLAHLYLPTRRLADYSAELTEKLAAMDRVFEVFDIEPDIKDSPGARPVGHVAGQVEFKDVHFAYNPGQPVLNGISLNIQPDSAVAIVGRSGAGKSTLVNLVPRFYDVCSGGAYVDGQDVRDVTVRSLRENIGIVLQDSILFNGTIRENILYGRHNATEEEMLEAARMAHVDEFAATLPDGYDTVVEERGVTMSGGQRQRISIARAFLRNPRILILDEATSNLDSGAELMIQDALRELMQGRTTLVIAHRLSTIIDCDLVVVLDQGRIVQQGRHRELICADGPYRRFCEEQFGEVGIENLSRTAIQLTLPT